MVNTLHELKQALGRAPVMGDVHPLVPLCLPADVEVTESAEQVAERLDDLGFHSECPVLITRFDPRYRDRFLVLSASQCPSAQDINESLPNRIKDARQRLLTHRCIAERVVTDVCQKGYETVALLLIDGLSYDDVKSWPESPEPCFIDGPTITYGRTPEQAVALEVGFAGIVGNPPLARRLTEIGIPHARGYSYWERDQNDVSRLLFQGMPLERVSGIEQALSILRSAELSGIYLQLVREGLDGLAHGRREVTPLEIQATVEAIHEDYHHLIKLVADSQLRGAIYLTADHGILWKNVHKLVMVDNPGSRHPRYAVQAPSELCNVSEFTMGGKRYYVYHYPHIACQIRANDSGVHGGLSYWESFVPFVRVEVNL